MPESLAEKVLAQLLAEHPDLTIEVPAVGCESCGYSTDTVCIMCSFDDWKGHRDGCSVPLIQAAQHEAGLHKEPK